MVALALQPMLARASVDDDSHAVQYVYLFLGSVGSGMVLGSEEALPTGERADEAEDAGEDGVLK